MLKTVISNRALIPLSLALAASAGVLTATPAQAGPFDLIKKEVSKAAKKKAKRMIESNLGATLQVETTRDAGPAPTPRNTAAAEGHFVHVFVDRETRRPVSIPDDIRAALEKLQPHAA